MKRLIVISIIALLICPGCASVKPQEEMTAHELAGEGMDAFKNKNYRKAIESFEKLKDWYPFSKYAILAELKIADGHYNLNEYDEAVVAYEEFEKLHPRNEAIPYVLYQIGLCYFKQIDTVDRDQTAAEKALSIFKRLEKQFPNNRYALQARDYINKCLKSLAGHEFYVGVFYYKSKHYKAALKRFRAVLFKYPDVGVQQKALQYIASCETLLNIKPPPIRKERVSIR